MAQGSSIRRWLEKLGLTQMELAERLYETAWTVRRWDQGEQGEENPQVEELLSTTQEALKDAVSLGSGLPWHLEDQLFSADTMYTRMKTLAQVEHLTETYRALPYMREMHAGQTRKPNVNSSHSVPYIVHPLIMACQAHAMGIREDVILATALLHDVCEDCGISPGGLPFSKEVQEAVALLTKNRRRFAELGTAEAEKEYYAAIRGSRVAMMVKCLDRCQNLSTMAGSFTRRGLAKYIVESETFVMPILEELQNTYPELSDAAFLLSYQMKSLLETQKALLMREPEAAKGRV